MPEDSNDPQAQPGAATSEDPNDAQTQTVTREDHRWGIKVTAAATIAAALIGGGITLFSGSNDDSEGSQPSPKSSDTSGDKASDSTNRKPEDDPAPKDLKPSLVKPVYDGRKFVLSGPHGDDCGYSYIDFDEGAARNSVHEEGEGADITLAQCFIDQALIIQAKYAGISSVETPTRDECRQYARQGGLSSIDDYGQLKKIDPIQEGVTLCFETHRGHIVRAQTTKAQWKTYYDDYTEKTRPTYSFNTTAWPAQ